MLGPIISENDPQFFFHGSLQPTNAEKNLKPCVCVKSLLRSHGCTGCVGPMLAASAIYSEFFCTGSDIYIFILMGFPIHIDTISMNLLILYFKGSQVEISKF